MVGLGEDDLGLRDQDADHVPGGEADQDATEIADEPGPVGEEREEVAAGDVALRRRDAGVLEHTGLLDADTGQQEAKAQAAADEIVRLPADILRHGAGDDGAEDAYGGNHGRTVAATLLRKNLRDQRDAPAELAGQADPGDETTGGVELQAVGEAVDDVGERVEQDRTEQGGQPPHAVGEDAEEQAPEEHPEHLPVERVGQRRRVAGDMERRQAVLLHGHHEREVVDVDEVTQGSDDHGGMQQVLPEGTLLDREIRGAHEGGVTPSDRADWPWKYQTTLPR